MDRDEMIALVCDAIDRIYCDHFHLKVTDLDPGREWRWRSKFVSDLTDEELKAAVVRLYR